MSDSYDAAPAIPPSDNPRFGRLIGDSLAMRQLFAVLERIAPSEVLVLLQGETGTGKELAAEAIHAQSSRAAGPFVICDLAGVTRTLIESELFGHVRGAFTGADRDRDGAFAQAAGGTLFLDEVAELEPEMQPRLLRALERHQVKPVGGSGYLDVNVRVIAATNRNLADEVRAGRFRDDLYHRLAVVEVHLPPLRDRQNDLLLLVRHFLGDDPTITLTSEATTRLAAYHWPGNVRELRNLLERGRSLLPPRDPESPGARRWITPELLGLPAETPAATPASPHERSTPTERYRLAKERMIEAWERAYLLNLLRQSDGNVSRAARAGGLDRVHLHRLIRKHGIASGRVVN